MRRDYFGAGIARGWSRGFGEGILEPHDEHRE